MKLFFLLTLIYSISWADQFNSFPESKALVKSRNSIETELYLSKTDGISTSKSLKQVKLGSTGYDPNLILKYLWKQDKNNYYGVVVGYGSKVYDSTVSSNVEFGSPVFYSIGGVWRYRFDRDLSVESSLGLSNNKILRAKTSSLYFMDNFDQLYVSAKSSYIWLRGNRSTVGVSGEFDLKGPFSSKKYSGESEDLSVSSGVAIKGELFSDRVMSTQSFKIGIFLDYERLNSNLYTQEEFKSGLSLKFKQAF